MTVSVPAEVPETAPAELTVATEPVVDQVPPGEASVSNPPDPAQTARLPVMAAGEVLTVTVTKAMQPDDEV